MSVEYKRIKNRRNTAAGWTQSNPILLEGELGIELDTSKFKFGDGTTHWNDLPYASADENEIQEIVESMTYTKAEVNTIINTVEGTIPTSTSQLTNDAGFITNADIPTNISAFNNDSGYITSSEIPAQVQSDWTETNTTKGSYIQHKPTLATVATTGSYNDLTDKPTIPGQVQADWTESDASSSAYIQHKPTLATVATSGNYTDLTNKPTIPTKTSDLTNDSGFVTSGDVPTKTSDLTNDSGFITLNDVPAQVNSDWNANSGAAQILNKPNLATVATSGSYNDLTDKPSIPGQVQSDWTENDTTSAAYIQHKPSLATVATSGDYNDLTNKPNLFSGDYNDLTNKPSLATVATSGDYNDLTNKPTIPTNTSDLTNDSGFITINDVPAQQQADWTEVNTTAGSYIQHKPSLATVATSGDYTDLSNTPSLATVATSGSYTDLSNTPTIPTKTSDLTNDSGYITLNDVPAQVNSDWNASSGVAEILNKPTIPTLTSQLTNDAGFITLNEVPEQMQADWTEANSTLGSYIQHKPTIYNEWFGTQQEYDAIVIKDADTIYHIEGGATVTWNEVIGKPTFATVATTGSYNDLSNTPTIPTDTSDLTNGAGFITINDVPAQAQADWTEADTSDPSYIQHKPSLATVATSGDYNDLTNTPTIPAAQVNSDWNAASGVAQILNKPTIPTNTSDLNNDSGFITISDVPAQVQADWTEVNTTAGSYIQHKPTIPTVNDATVTFTQGGVTKGSVTLNQGTDATIALDAGGTQVNADWTESDPTDPSYIENKPSLATVATSGSYTDLTNTPSIPAAQVNSDWNAASGVAQILNKPTIPTVPPMTTEALTFTLQGGTTKTIEFYVVPNFFYVEDVSGSDNTLTIIINSGSLEGITAYKSTDQKNWTSMGRLSQSGITATVPANSRLYLKTNGGSLANSYGNTSINCTNSFNVGGYIMSLVNGDNLISEFSGENNLKSLFKNSTTLINASDLVLSATTLTNSCYYGMFNGCTSLTTAPELPATTLAANCYQNMFRDCTSLATAPELPATTLANSCYYGMFYGCTSLTTAPTLPATTLANSCYYGMFYGCTSLTTAPTLPATTLVFQGYTQMFYNCTNLNKIICYANGNRDTWQTGNWVYGVGATGDFYKLGNYNFNTDASGIPSGWTEHTSL